MTPGVGTLRKYSPHKNCMKPSWFHPKDLPVSGRFWAYFLPEVLLSVPITRAKHNTFVNCWEHHRYFYFCNFSHMKGKLAIMLSYSTFITTCHSQQKITWKKLLQDTKKWLALALIIFQLALSVEGSRSAGSVCKHGAQIQLFIYILLLRCAGCKNA